MIPDTPSSAASGMGEYELASASVRPEPSTVACPHCERTVATSNDLYNHVKAKHGAKLARKLPRPKDEREQSIGEMLADALTDYAAGIEPPEALKLMFPEQFREVRRARSVLTPVSREQRGEEA